MDKIGYGLEKIIKLMPMVWEVKAKERGDMKKSAEDLLKVKLLYLTSRRSLGETQAMLK